MRCASPAGGCFRRPRPSASPTVGWVKARGRAASGGPALAPSQKRTRLRGLRLPEDLRDLVDLVEQLLALRRILRLLREPGLLGGVPEQLVQLRIGLEVVRLEVVGPQD